MEDNPYQAPGFSESPEIGASSVSEAELRAFVGKKAGYYLAKWSPALDDSFGRARGFNWAGFLLSGLWIPYRKMYRITLIFFSIIIATSVVEGIAYAAGFVSEGALATVDKIDRASGLVFSIICGMFGNSWYLAHAKREIARVRDLGLKDDEYYTALARRGGTNMLGALALFFFFFVTLALLSVLPGLLWEDPDL